MFKLWIINWILNRYSALLENGGASMAQKRIKEKTRYFTFLLYPDSSPKDFKELLDDLNVPIAISPLHDKDLREGDEVEKEIKRMKLLLDDNRNNMSKDEYDRALKKVETDAKTSFKKPHYHVMYVKPNPVTVDSVRKTMQRQLGEKSVAEVKIVDSMNGTYKYLTHESVDAVKKGKHVYDKKDITLLNNFDIDRYIVLDEAEKIDILNDILDLIRKYNFKNIMDFEDFYDSGQEPDMPDLRNLRNVIRSNTGVINMYFNGAFQREAAEKQIDYEKDLVNVLSKLEEKLEK